MTLPRGILLGLGVLLLWFVVREIQHDGAVRAWEAERTTLAALAVGSTARSAAVADSLRAARDTLARLDRRASYLEGVVASLKAKETSLLAGLGLARSCADSLPLAVDGWATCRVRGDSLEALVGVRTTAESTAVKALARQVVESDSLRAERDRWKGLAETAPTGPPPVTVHWPKYLPSISAGLTACTNGSSSAVGLGVTLGYRLFPKP